MSVVVEFTSDELKLFRGVQKLVTQQGTLQNTLRKTGATGKKAGNDASSGFGEKAAGSLLRYASGVVSVGAAITALSKGYDVWLKNIRETGTEAEKSARQVIALAALQEGGTKAARVKAASALGARYGITDRGLVFNTVQALQSANGGDFEKGLAGAKTVFAASLAGIPVDVGTELEVLGAGQGQKPGQALRRAQVAGEASTRDPAALATGAPGFTFIEDKDFGFAAAAILAGTSEKGTLKTAVQALGIGLSSSASDTFKKSLTELGVKKGDTQAEKLRVLHDAGIRTTDQLGELGMKEILRNKALSDVLKNYDKMTAVLAEIKAKAVPGLFAEKRAAIEAELPTTKLTREINTLKVRSKDAQALTPAAIQALEVDRDQRIRGLAFRRAGLESAGPWGMFDLIDESGRSTGYDQFWAKLFTSPFAIGHTDLTPNAEGQFDERSQILTGRKFREFAKQRQAIKQELSEDSTQLFGDGDLNTLREVTARIDSAAKNLNEATGNFNDAAGKIRGGATGMPPLEDK